MATTPVKPIINGTVATGFEQVRDQFERNFLDHDEIGAACAVYYQGEKVVDLWGGYRNIEQQLPWEEDTLVLVFSTTKGVASMALAHAHSRGLIDYDEKVVTYWQEFARNGKADVTVRQLLSHQAGVCAVEAPLTLDIIADPDQLATIIAAQKPLWEPGTRHGYHGITLGWYEGELIRRIDPQKRTIGQYFQEEIAQILDLEFYIGLPATVPDSRVATIYGNPRWKMLFNMHKLPPRFAMAMVNPMSITLKTFANPPQLAETENYNDPAIKRMEIPAANGIGQVRSIARAYGEFATGGKTLGLTAETLNALEQPAHPPSQGLRDVVLKMDTVFSLGYLKPFAGSRFGTDETAYGTPGAGGSFAFADPVKQLGFAYAMNKGGFYLLDDPREKGLRDAVYRCL